MKVNNELLGNNIKKLRKELNITQIDLALAVGYKSDTIISKIENGKKGISSNKLELIAKVLKTTPQDLIGWSENNNNTTIKPKQEQDKYYIDTSFLNEKQIIELNKVIDLNTTMFFNGGKSLTDSEMEYLRYLLTKAFVDTLND